MRRREFITLLVALRCGRSHIGSLVEGAQSQEVELSLRPLVRFRASPNGSVAKRTG